MAKLTKKQVKELREQWEVSKHIHITPDGKAILSEVHSDSWWCIIEGKLGFYSNQSPTNYVVFEPELLEKLFQDRDTSILEIIFALKGGYSK